jgi:protein-S-isoprenylcysteine O-methyltransferase Ste14
MANHAGERIAMNVPRAVRKALTNRILHTQVFFGMVFATLLVSTEGWEQISIIFEESLYLAGVALVALCLFGRAWSLSYISGSKDRALIKTGPYSLCRNPLYFSNFLGAVGLGLCTETLAITLVTVAAFAWYYPRVISREERRLGELFGAEFEAYRDAVPRFFPSPRLFVESETMLISLRAFRNGARDLGVIVLALGAIEFVEALHKAHVLPSLLTLY